MATKAQVKATVEAGMVAAGFRPRSGTDNLDMPHLHNDALIDGLYDAVESRHYKSFYDPTAELPADPALGDTYIAAATANGWTVDYIYEWTGEAWSATIPWEGYFVWIDDEDTFYFYDGTDWAEFTGGITITGAATTIVADNLTANRVAISNGAGKMAASDITTTALSYLDATSSIQTQLNGKQVTITGAATTIVADNLTANRVAISNGAGKMAASDITTTALSYLDATSSIQTQLNGKQVTITGAATTIVADNLTANRVAISNGAGKMAASDITTTALSYLDATSSIQTQLNGKEPTLTKGNLTSTGAIALDQTRQVIGGAAAISHSDAAGYKHVPTGGAAGQFLKYGGASGTPAWADHGLTATDVGALSGTGTDNYVAKYNGTGALQNSIIFDDDSKVGIGTNTPEELLDIKGGIKIQNYEKYYSAYSVPPATWVTINWREGVSTLLTSRVYRVTLSTSYTSSGGSAVYLIRCTNNDPLTFEAIRVSYRQLYLNAPSLRVNSDHLEIAQGHASNTYTVAVTVDTYYYGNVSQTQFAMIGIEESISTYNGNVGIGTETPAAKLQIAGIPSATFGIIAGNDITNGGMTDNTQKYLRIGCPSYDIDEEPVSIITVDNNGTDNILYLGGGTSSGNATTEIRLKTGVLNTTIGTDRVVIKSDGKIGIGTGNPVSTLDVLGTPITGYEERINALFVDSTRYGVGVGGGIGFRGKYNSAGDYETFGAIKGVKYTAGSGNNQGVLQFQTNTGTVLATVMTLTPGGAVGVGVTNPQAALHVTGFIRSDSLTASKFVVTDADKKLVSSNIGASDIISGSGTENYVTKWTSGGSQGNSIIFDNGTKVGIGTATPLTDVEIRPRTSTTVKLTITGDKSISAVGDEYCSVDFRSGGDTSPLSDNDIVGRIVSVAEVSNGARAGMAFYTADTTSSPYIKERVRIDNLGNVGIATGNPLKRLDVSEGDDVGIIIGADVGSTARTAVANRFAALGFLHYTATQEPVAGLFANVTSSLNQVCIGGGTSAVNAATLVEIYTAGNTTTPTGTRRLTVDSNGDVGIATSSSPLGRLDISDGGITIVGGADASATTRKANTTANFRMGSCHYNKSEEPASVFLATNSADDNSLRIGGGSSMMNAATNITFWTATNTTTTGGTERIRIMPDGGVFAYNLASGPAQTDINLDMYGEIIRVTSSNRYKENIRDLDIDSSVIHQFKLRRYDWKNDQAVAKSTRGMADFGFIAEQIAEVMPELCNYNTDGTVQSWKTVNMLELAVAEIQRQNGRINALEKHIHQLQEDKNGR